MAKIRDLERTRQRLLRAGLMEFSAKGFAGARTDAIAKRACVNKRMLFYCFGSKEGLYREVMRRKLMERAALGEGLPADISAALLQIYEVACGDLDWVRMMEWEALGAGRLLVEEKDRQAFLAKTLSLIDRFREQGIIPREVDSLQLFISFIAVAVFPIAFPQFVRMATGLSPLDERFKTARRNFLRWLGGRIQSGEAHDRPGARVSRNRTLRTPPAHGGQRRGPARI